MRVSALAFALLGLSWPAMADAEWQVRPSVGVNVAQNTTFFGSDAGASPAKFGFGVAGALIGNVLGVEADFGRRRGFFPALSNGAGNVLNSSVTTLTGNVTIALPRRLTEYTLRPYFVGGAGLMAVRIDQKANTFDVSLNMSAVDLGGGVTGFLTPRIGLNWDVRHFRKVGQGLEVLGVCIGPCELSFWRANMALAIRY
jgi:hypothetical protein